MEPLPEENEDRYYKRILKKYPEESDTEYVKRITVMKKHKPDLKVWKNNDYKSYVSQELTEDQHRRETEVTESIEKTVTRSVTESESPVTTEVSFLFSCTTCLCF